MEAFRRTTAEINLDHLSHNWYEIKNIAGDDRFVCPMIKANAYGHGAVEVALSLEREGVKNFGVCLIEEGLQLRAGGVKGEILVFSGFDKQGAEKILEYQLVPVVSNWEQIKALEATADTPVKVHLKFETGMNRLGFSVGECEKLVNYFKKSKLLKLKAILTHLAISEDSVNPEGMSNDQLKRFIEIQSYFSAMGVYSHVLNSGGILGFAKFKNEKNNILISHNWGFRPGLLLYGYMPAGDFSNFNFKAVMSFKSYIHTLRTIEVGETVSYGARWVARRKSLIAVVPAGYADGVHRQLSNRGAILISGHMAPIIGVVCMDFFMVDLTELVEQTGRTNWAEEEVIIFGYDEQNNFHSADVLANGANTISWDILTSVSYRVPRHFKGLKKS